MEQSFIKKIRWSTFAYGFLTVFMSLFFLSILGVYFFPHASPFLTVFSDKMPYPVAVIGYREAISFRELAENMKSVKGFYENQNFSEVGLRVDFSTEEGKKRLKIREKEVLNKMVEDQAMVILAKERDIFVSQEIAHQGVARKLEEYGNGTQVKENLKRLYGWDMADFEKKVVLPALYEEKLQEAFLKEADPVIPARAKIEKAAELLRQSTVFSDVVKQYSDGQTADSGGDLGWFALADLAPELRVPVASQKVGVPGNVIESTLGFHIVLVEEMKTEKSEQIYRIRQIFAKKETFADWLSDKMRDMTIWVPAPEYRFDVDTARIEFEDAKWQKYEEELHKKTTGDPSFFL